MFPIDFWLKAAPIIALYFLCVLTPVLAAIYFAFVKKPSISSKLRFIFVVSSMGYGSLLMVILLGYVPLYTFMVWIFPALEDANESRPIWLAAIFRWLSEYGFLLLSAYCFAFGYWFSKKLHKAWAGVLNAFS